MIETKAEYESVCRVVKDLDAQVAELYESGGSDRLLTLANLRRRIAKHQRELADFEDSLVMNTHEAESKSSGEQKGRV